MIRLNPKFGNQKSAKFDQVMFNSLVLTWKRNFEVVFSIFSLLYDCSSCPAFSQFDWLIIGQDSAIMPDGFSC